MSLSGRIGTGHIFSVKQCLDYTIVYFFHFYFGEDLTLYTLYFQMLTFQIITEQPINVN